MAWCFSCLIGVFNVVYFLELKEQKIRINEKKNDEEEKNDNDWMRLGMF